MKRTLIVLLVLFTAVIAAVSASASSPALLSPGLEVISNGVQMVKSGLVTGSIAFSRADFENGTGGEVKSVTVTSLPSPSDGILMYNGAAVAVNQTISANALSYLKYVPAENTEQSSFRFKTAGEYSIECVLKYTDTVNLAPTTASAADAVAVWTQSDISAFGKLEGHDPDGDSIVFEIMDYPEKGIIELTNAETGEYKYTPCSAVTGKDKFTYTVVDEWGNYSEKCTVVVDIDKAAANITLDDMDGHWAHNAALVMSADGIMETYNKDGKSVFEPSTNITREDFLVSAMKLLGAGDVQPAKTVFADDGEISESASGYVARAYSLGIIKGTEKDGQICFEPKSSVTRAEAAVILNTIIGAKEPDVVSVFADNDSVPAWARGSLYALVNEGIFKGNGEGDIMPNVPLNRAQTAQLFLKIKQIYS